MPHEFELRKEVVLEATPEQVWAAIATAEGNAAWFMTIDDIDPDAPNVLTWNPPHHLQVDAGTQAFEYVVEARDGGTAVLRFVHSGVLDDTDDTGWAGEYVDLTGKGWDLYFATLAQYFRHFAGRRATYVEANGPKATDEKARAALRAEFGLGDPPSVGEPVRLTLGDQAVEGEVDYTEHGGLGIRTADSLIRFHLRDRIGMSVAVSQHVYGTPVDAERLTRSWEDWLNRVLG